MSYGPSNVKPQIFCRGGEIRHGRRYSLRINGELLMPAEFNEIGVYNPNNLSKDVNKVAQHVATALDVEVEVVKHVANEDRVDRAFWPARY